MGKYDEFDKNLYFNNVNSTIIVFSYKILQYNIDG